MQRSVKFVFYILSLLNLMTLKSVLQDLKKMFSKCGAIESIRFRCPVSILCLHKSQNISDIAVHAQYCVVSRVYFTAQYIKL